MNEKNPFDSIPEDPNFVLVNPDEPDVNPQVWSETKGGTEGVFTGEKKAPRKKPSPRPKTSDSPYVTKRFLAVALVFVVILSSALGAFLGSRMSGGGSYSNLDSNNSLESATGSKLTIQQIYKKMRMRWWKSAPRFRRRACWGTPSARVPAAVSS